MTKTYKHLFFDLDHTLWDFEKNSETTLKKLYDEYQLQNIGVPDFSSFMFAYKVHNDKMWERFRNGFIKREELRWKRIWLTLIDFKIGDTALAYEMSAAYLEILPTQTALTPFAKELLDYCKDRYSLHLITNGFETTQWQKLQYSGISSYFGQVITSEKSDRPKPHREIFDYALQATGATAEQSMMIGDALEIDVLGALNAGWDQMYYNPAQLAHNKTPTYEVSCWREAMTLI
ncbi:MAG: YjjG family noncanonical pyrimidine nucleotidase [Bacteroidetes bacterium]|nr:YjjG family noncanonical pyrimidine nucleotidase [Bacteroidota bacterium]MBS1739876.1 YjjG family noncanonical pyrimidine nucleotidase [Bacteroidota bacterium]